MYRRDRNFLRFLKTGCLIYGYWPLNSDSSRWKRFSFEVFYLLVFVFQFSAITAIIHGFRCCYHSVSLFVKSTADIIFITETLYNWVYVRRRRKKFQLLLTRMEHFFNTTNMNLRQPIKACFILISAFVFGTVLYGILPFFVEKQMTPLTTVYFTVPTDKQWGRNLTFIMNIIIIANASSLLFVDMLVIFIMWHVSCKFSLLGRRFTISSEGKLKLWIKQHQDTLRYANEINSIIAILVVKSTIAVGLNMILCGLVIVRSHNFIELVKFFTLIIFSVLRFVICSWIADTMTENANGIAWKIYDSQWTYTTPRIRRMALLIIQRCQKPVAIHATGFLSSWNLKFCAQVLYTNATYLMTLRAVIRE